MKLEFTREQVEIMQNCMTKEQIATIRDALATEMDRLRDKLCFLYAYDDMLADAFHNKEEDEEDEEDEEYDND